MLKDSTAIVAGVVLGLGLVGCTEESKSKYDAAGQEISKAAKDTGQALESDAKVAGKDIKQAADSAGVKLKVAADKTKEASDNAVESTKVKTALNSASGLQAKDISVTTDNKAKTVTLGGTVPDSKQKAQALSIAKGIVGTEYKLADNLKAVAH